jgi:hypothetical protein
MYEIGRKYHRIERAGRRWLRKLEPYIGCSALKEEEPAGNIPSGRQSEVSGNMKTDLKIECDDVIQIHLT